MSPTRISFRKKSMATKNVQSDQGEPEENPHSAKTANKKRRIESQNVTLIDPEPFDCYICYEPSSIPVFQCENGHVACSDCCRKVKECPFCHMKIGDVCCRAIENVLESLDEPCHNLRYGCKDLLKFCERKEHWNTCLSAPCCCPLEECEFVAPSKKLYSHFDKKHPSSAIDFHLCSNFTLDLKLDDKLLVLREERVGALFVLASRMQPLGKAITVNSIGSVSKEYRPSFELAMKSKEITLSFHLAVMMPIRELVDEPPAEEFLMTPN